LRDDESAAVAAIATQAIVRARGAHRPLVDVLLEQQRDASANERSIALARLASLWPPVVPNLIAPSVQDEDGGVRSSACMALGELTNPEAIPLLPRAFVSDSDPRVVTSAALGLERYWTAEIGSTLLAAAERIDELPEAARPIVVRQLWNYPSIATNAVVARAETAGTGALRAAARSVVAFASR
jgi:HEAT repeat protein